MDRGYYKMSEFEVENTNWVAIHNKNGKGLLLTVRTVPTDWLCESQSTIKMDKGYYNRIEGGFYSGQLSQSTIKMEKGYYYTDNDEVIPF